MKYTIYSPLDGEIITLDNLREAKATITAFREEDRKMGMLVDYYIREEK